MNWIDFGLNVALLALVPFALAAYGGHLAAETIADLHHRRKAKVRFWSLCILGIVIAMFSQYREGRTETERQLRTADADRHAREAQAELTDTEKINSERLFNLQAQLNKLLMRPLSKAERIDTVKLRDEITDAVASKIRPQMIPPVQSQPTAIQSTTPVRAPTPPKECRGDALPDCSDEQLLQWGKPLMTKIEAVEKDYIAELHKLDEIKSSNVLRELTGIGDQYSRRLKAISLAEEHASIRFRDCCGQVAIVYYNELVQRVGSEERHGAIEWMQDLMKPTTSKEYKKALQSGGNVVDALYGIEILEIGVKYRGH